MIFPAKSRYDNLKSQLQVVARGGWRFAAHKISHVRTPVGYA
jgi:hypothetical protein